MATIHIDSSEPNGVQNQPVDLDFSKVESTYKADFARFLVHSDVVRQVSLVDWDKLKETKFVTSGKDANGLPNRAAPQQFVDKSELKVGIVGAGIAGLYTAWICTVLKIDWEIFEANPERVGGRLYTHYFNKNTDRHEYYDIGAMRYPKTPIMARTYKVFEDTDTKLGDYIMKATKQPMRYNDRTVWCEDGKPLEEDCFKVSIKNDGPVPDDTVRDPDEILNDAYGRFRNKIKRAVVSKDPVDYKRAFEYLLKHDRFSLRDYLGFVEGESPETVHWLETLNAGTGWFDQAFTENVIDSLAFDWNNVTDEDTYRPPPPGGSAPDRKAEAVNWKYIDGGSSVLVQNVLRKIDSLLPGPPSTGTSFSKAMEKIHMGKRVVKMRRDDVDKRPLTLWYTDDSNPTAPQKSATYDLIFNSTTLGAMQKMDLIGLDLPYDTKAAIRSLRYDASTKVGIRFKSQWWVQDYGIKGGLGKTDMPLRTCVYPSYNIGETPAVLLCSYTWGADSERVASMITDKNIADPKVTDPLMQIMLKDLARLHTTNDKDYEALLQKITDDFETYHAYDWTKDPYTCGGAFALFSPNQFSRMYPALIKPLSDSRVYIIGEAASAHHAWVVGALDSAARAMYLALGRFGLMEDQAELEKTFGEVGEVDKDTVYLQIALGMLEKKDRANLAAAVAVAA